MIHARLEGVARTLLMTLRARAEEHTRSDRLFADEWSYEWYQWMPSYPDLDAWYMPTFQLATAIRTLMLDEVTDTFIKDHKDPVIIEIGGGLSSRPYRIGIDRAEWVILDLPAAMSIRQKVDSQNDNLLFLSHSATDDNWFDRLPEYSGKNTLLIAEGVLMFIPESDVQTLINNLRGNFAGGTFVFDVLRGSYREREEENFAQMEAEIHFHIDEKDIKGLGVKEKATDYLLTSYPERWAELGVESHVLTKDNSGFVVTSTLPKL